MALPPTIPTSFVPRPSSTGSMRSPRPYVDFSGALMFVAIALFIAAILASLGVYFYNGYLSSQTASQDAKLTQKEAQIDQTTIASLLTLQQQLTEGQRLLDQHIAVSQFLDALGLLTPRTATFSSMSLLLNEDHSAAVSLTGAAASFNALAALATSLATNPGIKDAIFSGIAVAKGGVSFSLSAVIDPSLLVMPAAGFPAPAQTQTGSSTPLTP